MNGTKTVNDLSSNPADFTWAIFGANWFLIGVVAFIQNCIRQGGVPNGVSQILGSFFGGLVGIILVSMVPLAIAYLISSNKIIFRSRRVLTITAWCVTTLLFLTILR